MSDKLLNEKEIKSLKKRLPKSDLVKMIRQFPSAKVYWGQHHRQYGEYMVEWIDAKGKTQYTHFTGYSGKYEFGEKPELKDKPFVSGIGRLFGLFGSKGNPSRVKTK